MTTLNIIGENLNTRQVVNITLKGSNAFTILPKYLETIKDLHVEDYTLTNEIGEGGNRGMNAGAYLNEVMEELTGMDLRFNN
jgi:hypothetical protein